MNSRQRRNAIAVLAACLAAAGAQAGNVDEELREAAKLHRIGETAKAMAIWRAWAEKGDADAAYNLGVIHHYGDGVAKDTREAIKWYKLAAERGDKPAHYQIGLIYQNGDGVPADAAEAHRWFVAPRQHHIHHQHDPKLQKWRKEAAELIWARDMRESLAASRQNAAEVVAELQRRAGMAAGGEAAKPAVAMSRPDTARN